MLYDPMVAFNRALGDHHYLHARALEKILQGIKAGTLDIARECPDFDPRETLKVSPGQPDSTHIVCCKGKHFRIGARVSGFQPIASYGMITEGFVEEMGACDNLACAQATELPFDWVWQHCRHLLAPVGALVPVPEGMVLYRKASLDSGRNTGTHVAYHNAGMLVLPSLLRNWSLLKDGGEIKTEEQTWYRFAREVTTHYIYRNTGGMMEKVYAGGG
jgi:hypothetical protein